MKHYDRIVFIDEDDAGRAVMACRIMRQADLLSSLRISSRGLVNLFPGPVNQKAEAVLAANGLSAADHVTKQLTREDMTDRTLLITMEEKQKERVREMNPSVKNLYTISEYTGFRGDVGPLFGAELPEYGKCFLLLKELVKIIVKKLNEEEIRK